MSASPIVAGRLYRVRGHGIDLQIIANHPCQALRIAASQLFR